MKLHIDGVTKRFGNKVAVNGVSVELGAGVYGLLGPNGSGKTTLMRMLADVAQPTSGRILFDKVDIRILDEKYRDIIGYVPQQVGVYKHFTAERFLQYMSSLKGLSKSDTEERINEVLHMVNLEAERHVKLGKFSGGMRQRIGIAQALLNRPQVLILDEPTAGLDPTERIRFRNIISSVADNRIVLLATHIVTDIESVADNVLLMKQGQITRQGSPETLLAGLQGKVWTTHLSEQEAASLKSRDRGRRLSRTASHTQLRIISDTKPNETAELAIPNLEDLYLFYFQEETFKEAQ